MLGWSDKDVKPLVMNMLKDISKKWLWWVNKWEISNQMEIIKKQINRTIKYNIWNHLVGLTAGGHNRGKKTVNLKKEQ